MSDEGGQFIRIDDLGLGDISSLEEWTSADKLASAFEGAVGVKPAQKIDLSGYFVTSLPMVGQQVFFNGRLIGTVASSTLDEETQEVSVDVTPLSREMRKALRPQAWRRGLTLARDPHHRSRGQAKHLRRKLAAERRCARG